MFVVGCHALNEIVEHCCQWMLLVSGYSVSVVGCRLSVSVIAQFFSYLVPNSSSRQLRLGKLIQ